ncbi:hypothetical protein IAG41_22385 [Sphingomonas sp. JC676]|uniref:hypothetical protein n=1 Tax=Sphingomonas sp. JC676 TaxID=2768065 RepID=UPI0016583D16|nr:hypothetical protein [Sphingomonas sp. JC676]MBC9035147.1 hypothetical protein [Sphingomonas sp. JC676]
MASIRTFRGSLCAVLALAACGLPLAQGQAQVWEVVVQQGGHKVARGGMHGGAGLMRGIGLTCERNVPIIAIGLARAPARNPALLSFSDGRSTGKLGVVRNGASNVWAGPVRDTRVLDMLARAESVEVAIDGVRYGTVSLAGAGQAMQGALGGCYAAAAIPARVPVAAHAATSRAVFGDTTLPPVVRRDLTDFDQSCAAPNPFDDGQYPTGRGTGLAALNAISRADFNGDGVQDFVVDTSKLWCSLDPRSDNSGAGTLFIYTSLPDGSIVSSLAVPVDRFTVIANKKATLRIHQDAVTDEIEDDNHPEINEILTMVSATRWSRSEVATADWRLGALDKFPVEVKSYFAELDRRCAEAGRRLTGVRESLAAVNSPDMIDHDEPPVRLDFNADGVLDHIVDTSNLQCGMFGVEPKAWPKPCGPNCVLVAFVSKAGGGHLVSPVPGFGSFNGNGDPDYLGKIGKRDVICSLHHQNFENDNATTYERYSWNSITGQRTIVRKGQGCG